MTNAVKTFEDAQIVSAADAPMVAMIERIAMDPSVPIERLEQMMAMKERMEDRAREDRERQDKRAYAAAMAKCQAELPVVIKKSKNTHTNSNYADLAAIEMQAMPIIHKHGFAVSFYPDGYNEKGELRIIWEITHSEGHSKSGTGDIPVDGAGSQGKVNKTGTQAFGSTATYGRRYLLCMLFNISTGDDTDGNQKKPESANITEDQFIALRDLMEQAGGDESKFLAFFKVDQLVDLTMDRYGEADSMLRRKIAQKGGAQ